MGSELCYTIFVLWKNKNSNISVCGSFSMFLSLSMLNSNSNSSSRFGQIKWKICQFPKSYLVQKKWKTFSVNQILRKLNMYSSFLPKCLEKPRIRHQQTSKKYNFSNFRQTSFQNKWKNMKEKREIK